MSFLRSGEMGDSVYPAEELRQALSQIEYVIMLLT